MPRLATRCASAPCGLSVLRVTITAAATVDRVRDGRPAQPHQNVWTRIAANPQISEVAKAVASSGAGSRTPG